MNEINLSVGQGYSKEQIEKIFNTNFGARIKGITLRRTPDDKPYTIIFSRDAGGPYTDRIEGTSFYYDGEGTAKDQILTPANKSLVNANRTDRIIYGFRQEKGSTEWGYMGILEVLDYSYAPKNGYLTYEFHFTTNAVNPIDFASASKFVDKTVETAPALLADTHRITVSITARDAAFSKNIKKIYNNTCAVCHKKRYSAAGYPEVEAAHIYPKEKQGADDLRNGLALCKLHHWAFDSGLLAISDELRVLVKAGIDQDSNYEDVYKYSGLSISLPNNKLSYPHTLYLDAHRKIHGFSV